MKDTCCIANNERAILKPGMELILVEDCEHGDYKTASVWKDRWPTLKKGTEVVLIEIWKNFYGVQCKVRAPSGVLYDIEPRKVEIKGVERGNEQF